MSTLVGRQSHWTVGAIGSPDSVADGPAFVARLDLAPLDADGGADLALALTLPCWTLLGMLDRAMELTIAHVTMREQFGQPLSAFQSVQFQLTDGEVERAGLEVLAKYTLWSVGTARDEALDDALALRMAALEAAEVVFRVTHQLHGAVGFCDETTLSWLSRYSQPLRRLPLGLSATRDLLSTRVDRSGLVGLYGAASDVAGSRLNQSAAWRLVAGSPAKSWSPHGSGTMTDLDEFRTRVRRWCQEHVPSDWRAAQTGVTRCRVRRVPEVVVRRAAQGGLRRAALARRWGGGLSVGEQIVLYQELAAHDAPRLVLAFVSIHHAASTLLTAGTEAQRQRHLPAILDGEIWVQGFSEPEAGSDLASLRTTAKKDGDTYVVNGQKLWASGGMHADWCLLLARTDPDAAKRKGISYFLMDMASPGIDVRPIRNAVGDSHFCEVFLDDVVIPAENLLGAENMGWQVAQQTLGAERGMTMLELAERLDHGGFRWLVEECARPGLDGTRPIDDGFVRDRLAAFETEISGLRGMCRKVVEGHDTGACRARGPLDRQAVLQRVAPALDGFRRRDRRTLRTHRARRSPCRAAGNRVPGSSTSSVRGSGRSPAGPARSSAPSSASEASASRENRSARDIGLRRDPRRTAFGGTGSARQERRVAAAGGCRLAQPGDPRRPRRRRSVVRRDGDTARGDGPRLRLEPLPRHDAGGRSLTALSPNESRDALLVRIAEGATAAIATGFTVSDGAVSGRADFVPDALEAESCCCWPTPTARPSSSTSPGLTVSAQPVLDETRTLATVSADERRSLRILAADNSSRAATGKGCRDDRL